MSLKRRTEHRDCQSFEPRSIGVVGWCKRKKEYVDAKGSGCEHWK